MKTLDEIGIEHQTDKASQFSRTYAPPHDYLRQLEPFLVSQRNEPIRILEIGVGGGESVKTWLDYFPNALVYGVDLVHDTNEWNDPKTSINGRYTFCQGNQSDEVFWKCFIATYGVDWDVIIDDGSHISSDILTTFVNLWPHLKSGGIYQIEDLAVAPEAKSFLSASVPTVLGGAPDIDSIHFSKELVIIRKR